MSESRQALSERRSRSMRIDRETSTRGSSRSWEFSGHRRAASFWTRIFVSLSIAAATGCGTSEQAPEVKPLVVVSVAPQAYFVERIAGDLVEIEVLIPSGANPATYEPTLKQMRSLGRALFYFSVGHPNFPFEKSWLGHLVQENSDLTVVDGSSGIEIRPIDPHLWVSPACAKQMSRNIAAALEERLPEESDLFAQNLTRFEIEIDALDARIRVALRGTTGGRFLVQHPAWGYFADEYGLEQVAIAEEGKDPSPEQLARLISMARRDSIRVLFVQPQFSQRSAELIAEEIGGRVVTVDPLSRDWLTNLEQVAEAFVEAMAR